MKKLLIGLAFLVSLAGLVGGCGLLDATDGITISLPTQEFEFELDANQARSQLEQALNDQLPQGMTLDLTGEEEIPQQVCDGQDNCVDVPTVEQTFTFDLPPQQVDLSDEDELKKYVEAGKVREVTIEFVNYDLTQNSLNFNLPEIELYMDAIEAEEISDSSDEVAVLPAIEAGQTGEGQLQFTQNGRQIMSNYLLGYTFAMLGRTSYTIDTAVTRTIPQGMLRGVIAMQLSFKVDPL